MRAPAVLVCALLSAATAYAQPAPPVRQRTPEPYPAVAARGFVLFGQQRFAAERTFEAIVGEPVQPFRGGGADVVVSRYLFAELGLSRFALTGERVFRAGGETFGLGLPLTVTITPLEVTGGYRLAVWRRVIPYAGVGVGWYRYEETSSFSAEGEDVDVRTRGFLLVAGAEVRVARWLGVGADVRRTSIGEVLGDGGVSREFEETDLGGTAFRIRIMVGR